MKKRKINNIILIIIPRHIHRCDEIIQTLNKMNLKVCSHSDKSQFNNDVDIYLVDTYGESQKFFNIARSVFLAISFAALPPSPPIGPILKG